MCDSCPPARSSSNSTSDGPTAALAISACRWPSGWSVAASICWKATPLGVPRLASSPAGTAGNENTAVFVGTSGRRVFTAAFAQNPADERLLTELTSLERASWEATIRDDKEFFRGYMAPEFKGFFADGTVAGREEFLRNLDDFHLAAYTMGEVSMMQINEHAVMVLYRASFEGIHKGKRLAKSDVESSSLYVRRDGKWLEIFYQETAIPAPAPPTK